MHRDLRDNVGGASEAIDPEVSGFLDRTCHHQRPVADQARAEKRSRLHVAIKLMQRKTERRLGHGVFGVATVDRVSGEPGVVTEVFPVRLAIHTLATGPAKPRDPHARPDTKILDLGTTFYDLSDDFMAWYERKLWIW
jgi:hypothetical protein